jgi:hypothetical protein
MPYSSDEGKGWITSRIMERRPSTVLDVGVGCGTYAHLLRPGLPGTRMIGVEVWQPYVHRFRLDVLYDTLIVGDARTVGFPFTDVVILGDVLEHVGEDDALALWQKCRDTAPVVYLSLPIVHWPQGPEEGNPHEEHVAHWTHLDVLDRLEGITDYREGDVVGVYEAT